MKSELKLRFALCLSAIFILTQACQQKKSNPAAGTPISPVSVPNASSLPPCTAENNHAMLFIQNTKDTVVCNADKWQSVNELANSPSNKDFRLEKTALPPGDECRYGGSRIVAGTDTDKNGSLSETEASNAIAVCDASIENIAKSTFTNYVHSIGLVIVKSKGLTSTAMSGGTGWLIGDGLIATNGHVVETSGTTISLGTEILFYTPKTTAAAEMILSKGLPNYTGFQPSDKDFDVFKADAVDRTPYTIGGLEGSDLAFLRVPSLTGRKVLPLSDLPLSTIAGTAADLSDVGASNYIKLGDSIFTINYSQTQGPRLSLGTVTNIQTCASWLKNYTNSSCASDLNIPDQRRLLFWWGYGDHGGSGSPVFDRFGKVVGIFTFASVPPDTFIAAGQFVGDIRRWLAVARSWKAP